jgi:hypothetical protein
MHANTPTAYRWLDEESGLVAWLLRFPTGSTVSGFESTPSEANTRIWVWCRRGSYPRVVVYPHHPETEVRHAS